MKTNLDDFTLKGTSLSTNPFQIAIPIIVSNNKKAQKKEW